MSSPSRRPLLRQPEVVENAGCSYRSSKLVDFFSCSSLKKQSISKMQTLYTPPTHQSSSLDYSLSPSPSPSPSRSPSPVSFPARGKKQGILKGGKEMEKMGGMEESVEVVIESRNPYLDFRESMVMMIVEKEIYGWDDLRELLLRFLSLNDPRHHPHILRAFTETLFVLFSPAAVSGETSGQ